MERINVNLGERSYPITIGAGLLHDPALFSDAIHSSQQVVIISNEIVAPLYADSLIQTVTPLAKSVDLLVLPDGEQYKSLATFEQIMTFLLEGGFGRDVVLLALGGGVIGDLVGFAAASYQRGVDFIQVPTTLLSQVDSSVGGKTAVNHPLGKNMIGAFYQPKAVVIDIMCLQTLPERELAAGMAEVIKYGIIVAVDFFEWLECHLDDLYALDATSLTYAIASCCRIKADVVAQDEKESGIRALLNLGHTFGHAIETEMGYGHWLHGEAVAVGMMLAAKTTYLLDELNITDMHRIRILLTRAHLPIEVPDSMTFEQFMAHMMRDKKVLSGQLRLVLPTAIGRADVRSGIPESVLREVISVS